MIRFDVLTEHGTIAAGDLDLFRLAGDAEEIWQILLRCGVKPGETVE